MKSQIIEAAKLALAECLDEIKATDAHTYQGIAQALQAGAVAQTTVSLSLAGLAETAIDLVLPNGEKLNLGHIEYAQINMQ